MTISLDLLHPSGLISLRNWTFEDESVIRIGREPDNHIVLYSRVVSRFHAMLWGLGDEWKIVNLSCNGTYLDQKPITHALLPHGMIMQLAPSGPKLRFRVLTLTNQTPKWGTDKKSAAADLMRLIRPANQDVAVPDGAQKNALPGHRGQMLEMLPQNR
jgi:pSer/pThr/pTyr-binding forkhead associated (FHA) protein